MESNIVHGSNYVECKNKPKNRLDSTSLFVIGITGPSGSGKSTLSTAIANEIDGEVFVEDPKFFVSPATKSYKDRDPVSETPEHVKWEEYLAALQQAIQQCTKPYLIVEHFLLLYHIDVIKQLHGILFLDPNVVDTPDNDEEDGNYDSKRNDKCMRICMERRLYRNPNRSDEECQYLKFYYINHVWPSYKLYTEPYARILIDYCRNAEQFRRKEHKKRMKQERHSISKARGARTRKKTTNDKFNNTIPDSNCGNYSRNRKHQEFHQHESLLFKSLTNDSNDYKLVGVLQLQIYSKKPIPLLVQDSLDVIYKWRRNMIWTKSKV